MECQRLRDLAEKVLHKVAINHGFTDPRLDFSDAAKKGDNFAGQVYRFVISDGGRAEKTLDVVVKLPPANLEHRKAMRADDFFGAEVYAYEKLLPALTQYYNKIYSVQDVTFPCFPRTHAIHVDEEDLIIVLEDLKSSNFVMKDKRVGLDQVHCRLVLNRIARLHAASLALRKDNPNTHENLANNCKEVVFHREKISTSFKLAIEKFRGIIDDPFPLGSPIRTKVERFLENYHTNMQKAVSRNSALSCITHGDLWTNNILFQYKEGLSVPQELYFVDLQMSRVATPITDVVYFLTLCPSNETQHLYMDLVKHYHNSLCTHLKEFGQDPEEIVPWTLLKEELLNYGYYGWAMSIVSIPAINLEAEDIDLLDKESNGPYVHAHHHVEKKNAGKIKTRFTEILLQADHLGLL